MTAHSARTIAMVAFSVMVAGCANDGTIFPGSMSTSSIDASASAPASKSNPVCLTLASQIDALNKEGIPDKVSKAAAKKYKLKGGDIAKADELNRANSEFQSKCSEYPPAPTVAAVVPAEKPAAKVASKAKPPVPSPKPTAAAIAPENTSAATGAGATSASSGAVAETAAAPSPLQSGY